MSADDEEKFQEELGMRFNPEEEARKALKEYQAVAGMVFADPDAPVAPDAKSVAQAEDEEIGGSWLGARK